MNNLERELKLQAYLDGELPAAEAAEVERWLDQDAEMLALSTELRHTKDAFAVGELAVKCPETREFYWSKIARSIEADERQAERAAAVEVPWWRKLLVPVGALAAVVVTLATLQMQPQTGEAGGHKKPTELAKELNKAINQIDSAVEVEQKDDSMGAITFSDNSEGVTVVWHYERAGDI